MMNSSNLIYRIQRVSKIIVETQARNLISPKCLVDIFAITAKHGKQTLIRDGILHFIFQSSCLSKQEVAVRTALTLKNSELKRKSRQILTFTCGRQNSNSEFSTTANLVPRGCVPFGQHQGSKTSGPINVKIQRFEI